MDKNVNIEHLVMLLQLPKIDRKTALKICNDPSFKITNKNDFTKYILANRKRLLLPEVNTTLFNTIFNKTDKIIKDSEAEGIKLVSIFESHYPNLLKTCFDAPIVLNYKGNIEILNNKPSIALVGTRTPTILGQQCSEHLGAYFAKSGFNVVSGLAKGCDTGAHNGTLSSNGTTIAVLAHGLDIVYPKQNSALAKRIAENGVLISEYFTGDTPKPQNFIQRDRIQAGLSLATIVVETEIRGGTMHTVNYCLGYKRMLACLNPPQEYYEILKFQGNRILINQGKAKAVYSDSEVDQLINKIL